MHHPLAHTGRSGENALGIEADGNVAVVSCYPTFLKDQTTDLADVLAIFALRFHHAGSFDCSRQGCRNVFAAAPAERPADGASVWAKAVSPPADTIGVTPKWIHKTST